MAKQQTPNIFEPHMHTSSASRYGTFARSNSHVPEAAALRHCHCAYAQARDSDETKHRGEAVQ